MPLEIERKFLVDAAAWHRPATGTHYRQGYLSTEPACSVRVRLAGEQAWLTIKGETVGITRVEYEYPIPTVDAGELLDHLCKRPLIEKTRYRVEVSGLVWEVDEFHGANAGLVIAEVELANEHQHIELPDWTGREVTGDPRYYNASLVDHPYCDWPAGDTDPASG
ncbi:MAG TPA: CYTH domain-containing protein [Gammaproteobacteria bacterium]|nr:CYTH domain-containing protein [Gammaproteobacteria bacterium]